MIRSILTVLFLTAAVPASAVIIPPDFRYIGGTVTQAVTFAPAAGVPVTITETGGTQALDISGPGSPAVRILNNNAAGGVAASFQRSGTAGTAIQVGDNVTLTNVTVSAAGAIALAGVNVATTAAINMTGGPAAVRMTGNTLAAPSAGGSLTNGDRVVLYDDGTGKLAIGVQAGGMYFQSTTATDVFGFYNGTTVRYTLGAATTSSITFDADGASTMAGSTLSIGTAAAGTAPILSVNGPTTADVNTQQWTDGTRTIALRTNITGGFVGLSSVSDICLNTTGLVRFRDGTNSYLAFDSTSNAARMLAAGAATTSYLFNETGGTANIAAFQDGGATRFLLSETGELSFGYSNTSSAAGTTVIASGVGTTATADDDNAGAITASFAPAQTIAANTLQAGAAVRVYGSGVVTSDGAAGNLTFLLVFGGTPTTLVTTGAQTLPNNLTNAQWRFEGVGTCRTVGASGTVIAEGIFTIWTAATTAQSWSLISTAAVTYDTTAAQDWALRTTASDAGTTITAQQIVWELLPQ